MIFWSYDILDGGNGVDNFSCGGGTDTITDFSASQEDAQYGYLRCSSPGTNQAIILLYLVAIAVIAFNLIMTAAFASMCALSDEDISIRREYYKKVKSQKYARFPKAIPAPSEDPSVSILVKSSNLEKLKNLH